MQLKNATTDYTPPTREQLKREPLDLDNLKETSVINVTKHAQMVLTSAQYDLRSFAALTLATTDTVSRPPAVPSAAARTARAACFFHPCFESEVGTACLQ